MKPLKFSSIATLMMILFMGLFSEISAQDKGDVVVMLNGEQKEGKVTGISDNSVKFVYSGETLEYELKKSEINKIEFASGRTEVINEVAQASATAAPASNPADRKNKIAVLPFDFMTNDPTVPVDPMHTRIQSSCINSIRENTKGLDVQDPMTTNSILTQNNISAENMKSVTPKDMAIMLGVEYVVYGAYELIHEGSMTTGSGVTTYKEKETKKGDYDDREKKSKGTAVSSSSSSTRETYDSRLDLNIYNDQGENIYSDSRRPFSAGVDEYKSPIDYLVKRTPFGSKGKKK